MYEGRKRPFRRLVTLCTGLLLFPCPGASLLSTTKFLACQTSCRHPFSKPHFSVGDDTEIIEQETMSAQERVLRKAGLWDEDEEGKSHQEAKEITPTASQALEEQRGRNLQVAIISVVLAITSFFWEYTHPVTNVQLLMSMQQSSVPACTIGTNGKPSVVDFWAPWCENCKLSAPTLHKVEEEYRDRVNFIMVNGDQAAAWPYIEAFGVDAIPHLALVNADGDVETALIGPTPKSVLEADLDVLIDNADGGPKRPLPYVMLDVFANNPEKRRMHFDK
jgi:thiol-disulfide isomerase/thioredoxin